MKSRKKDVVASGTDPLEGGVLHWEVSTSPRASWSRTTTGLRPNTFYVLDPCSPNGVREGQRIPNAHRLKGFEKGDIVTRDGTDRQLVLDVNDVGDMITVECIKEPLGAINDDGTRDDPWCRLGEIEDNLARRYSYADDTVEDKPYLQP